MNYGTSDSAVTDGGGPHWLPIRRRITDGEVAFARAPGLVPLALLVHLARARWKAENRLAAG